MRQFSQPHAHGAVIVDTDSRVAAHIKYPTSGHWQRIPRSTMKINPYFRVTDANPLRSHSPVRSLPVKHFHDPFINDASLNSIFQFHQVAMIRRPPDNKEHH